MRVAVFSTHTFDRQFLDQANVNRGHDLHYLEARLTPATCALARDCPAVCAFVNDQLNADVLALLASGGTRMIALRSAGFNHVDLRKARELGFTVARVPVYSPYAVAEHTIALILVLDRKIYRAYSRVRDGNFALDGLLGFDLHGRTVGIVGTGTIGTVVARILDAKHVDLASWERDLVGGVEVRCREMTSDQSTRNLSSRWEMFPNRGRQFVAVQHRSARSPRATSLVRPLLGRRQDQLI